MIADLKFTSTNGNGRPSAQARRYVYGVLVAMLHSQLHHHPENVEGWMFGGIENDADRRRVKRAIERLQKEFSRKANP